MARAFGHESLALVWQSEAGEVQFRAGKGPFAPAADALDRNNGDNRGCSLTAVVSATEPLAMRPDNLPEQGDFLTDADGRLYRVESITYRPGAPKIVFHVPNITQP
jgi:hypothetical protein